MDPNETLRLLRDAINRSVIAGMRRDREDETDALLDIREHVENLDRWLKGGGFLPDEWRPATASEVCTCRCREGRHCGGCGHPGCGYPRQ